LFAIVQLFSLKIEVNESPSKSRGKLHHIGQANGYCDQDVRVAQAEHCITISERCRDNFQRVNDKRKGLVQIRHKKVQTPENEEKIRNSRRGGSRILGARTGDK
jgi:hypothetical protein